MKRMFVVIMFFVAVMANLNLILAAVKLHYAGRNISVFTGNVVWGAFAILIVTITFFYFVLKYMK